MSSPYGPLFRPFLSNIEKDIGEWVRQKQQETPLLNLEEPLASIPWEVEPLYGDISTPIAFQLAKLFRSSPKDLAIQLAAWLLERNSRSITALNGYVNVYFPKVLWNAVLRDILFREKRYGHHHVALGKTASVEYVSANPTGPLHAAHARGAVLGDVLSNLLEAVGYRVEREYFINDTGAQIQKLGKSVFLRCLGILLKKKVDPLLQGLYPGEYLEAIALRFLGGETAEDRESLAAYAACLKRQYPQELEILASVGRAEQESPDQSSISDTVSQAKVLENATTDAIDALKDTILAIHLSPHRTALEAQLQRMATFATGEILEDIKGDMASIGIHPTLFVSEKSLHQRGVLRDVMEKLQGQDLLYWGKLEALETNPTVSKGSGTLRLFRSSLGGDDQDRAVQREDLSFTYFAGDIAYHWEKVQRGHSIILNVWGADHDGHVHRIKHATSALTGENVEVVLCQMVHFYHHGELLKMSKRSGSFITLKEILLQLKSSDILRFMMVSKKADTHLNLDLEEIQRESKENPLFYIQYAHARCCSILKEAKRLFPGMEIKEDAISVDWKHEPLYEKCIAYLAQWPGRVEEAAMERDPQRITAYLLELAQKFHGIWQKGNELPSLRFLHEDRAAAHQRVLFTQCVAFVLQSGLGILGISPKTVLS